MKLLISILSNELNKLYCCDFRDIFNDLPLSSLIITDPPYNIGYKYSQYKDKMNEEEYMKMFSIFAKNRSVFIHYPEETINLLPRALSTKYWIDFAGREQTIRTKIKCELSIVE